MRNSTKFFRGGGPPYLPKKAKIGSESSETSDMTSEWLGEMFERDCAEICVGKIPLVPMGQGGIFPGNLGTGFPRNPYSQAKYLLDIPLFSVKEKDFL